LALLQRLPCGPLGVPRGLELLHDPSRVDPALEEGDHVEQGQRTERRPTADLFENDPSVHHRRPGGPASRRAAMAISPSPKPAPNAIVYVRLGSLIGTVEEHLHLVGPPTGVGAADPADVPATVESDAVDVEPGVLDVSDALTFCAVVGSDGVRAVVGEDPL